jgi:hypothetical protein
VIRFECKEKGSVLIEGILVLSLLILPSMAFNLELIRAAQMHVMSHHWCFIYVRLRSLGRGENESRRTVHQWTAAALGRAGANRLWRIVRSETWRDMKGIRGRVQVRYQGLFPLYKDRLQVTKQCLFSF